MTSLTPSPLPHGDTALRLSWRFLPPHIRSAVERNLGSPVVDSRSCDAGFTSGFASVLTCANGTQHFVKGSAATAQQRITEDYREEVRVLSGLPSGLPVPKLRWVIDEDWYVFSTQFVTGRAVARPWREADLAATLDACERIAAVDPAGSSVTRQLHTLVPGELSAWDKLPDGVAPPSLLAEARDLAALCSDYFVGDRLVHQDLRDDNVLITASGRACVVDWNWPALGPGWLDSLAVLVDARGDGLDVSRHLAERPLLREVPDEAIDAALALWSGTLLAAGTQEVPTNSPHLRDAQWWQGEACWRWLAQRRGWPEDEQ